MKTEKCCTSDLEGRWEDSRSSPYRHTHSIALMFPKSWEAEVEWKKSSHFRQEGKSLHLGTFKTNEFWDPLLLWMYGKPPCKATSRMWAFGGMCHGTGLQAEGAVWGTDPVKSSKHTERSSYWRGHRILKQSIGTWWVEICTGLICNQIATIAEKKKKLLPWFLCLLLS